MNGSPFVPGTLEHSALKRLNPALPPEANTAAVDELPRDRSAMSLEAANREFYRLLKEGIPVSVMERDSTSGRAELPLRPNVPGGAATPNGMRAFTPRRFDRRSSAECHWRE